MSLASVLGNVTNLEQQFSSLDTVWSPKVVAQTEEYKVVLLLAEGDFIWHVHEEEDKFFMVLDGELFIDFRGDRRVSIKKGEFFIVPRGEHNKPWSETLTRLLLIEPIVITKEE